MFRSRRQLKREIANLSEALAESNKKYDDLFKEAAKTNTSYEEQIRSLCERIQDLNGKLTSERNTNEMLRKMNDNMAAKVNEAKETIEGLETEVKRMCSEIEELTKSNGELRYKLSRKSCNTTPKKSRKITTAEAK